MNFSKLLIIGLLITCFQANAGTVNIKANELNNDVISKIFSSPNTEYVVEFREGDLVPFNLSAEGDLFESKENTNNILKIKKDFFVKVSSHQVLISFDSENYKNLKEVISGSFTVGSEVDRSQIPGVIQALLRVYLK